MRVSAGFEVTTLSGKIRIQTLPPRLRWWVIVRRAASIWRAVIHAGSSVRMAYSPKAIVLPRSATPPSPPWVRFIILRCFIRLGCSMALLLGPCRRWRRPRGWCWRGTCRGRWWLRRSRRRGFGLAGSAWAQLTRLLAGIEDTARRVVDLGGHGWRGCLGRGCLGYLSANRGTRTAPIGLALLGGDLLRAAAVGGEVAAVDPYLDADDAVRRVRLGLPVVDVGAQRVQRHATPAVPLAAAHFRAAQASRDLHAHALGAKALRALDGLFHGAAERDAFLQLIGDRSGYQEGIDLGLADLLDRDPDALARHRLERAPQLFDLDAALANDDAWLGRVDRDRDHVRRALDFDLGHARVGHAGHDVLADLDVLEQQQRVLVASGEPAALPVLDRPLADFDTQAEARRVNFLAHRD